MLFFFAKQVLMNFANITLMLFQVFFQQLQLQQKFTKKTIINIYIGLFVCILQLFTPHQNNSRSNTHLLVSCLWHLFIIYLQPSHTFISNLKNCRQYLMHALCSDAVHVKRHAAVSYCCSYCNTKADFLLKLQKRNALNHVEKYCGKPENWKDIKEALDYLHIQVIFVQCKKCIKSLKTIMCVFQDIRF